jgi:hypothetical protein
MRLVYRHSETVFAERCLANRYQVVHLSLLQLRHTPKSVPEGDFSMKRSDKDQPPQSPKTPLELEEAVRRRAYQIYEERGLTKGLEMEDWLQAEAVLLESQRGTKAA